MSLDNFFEGFRPREDEEFKRCARTLLNSNFIVQAKDDKLYRYAAQRSVRDGLTEYFEKIGYDLVFKDDLGLIMLRQLEDDEDGVGTMNKWSLKKDDARMLLVLMKIYREALHVNIDNVVPITYGTLIDRMVESFDDINKTKIGNGLKKFKQHNLIDCPIGTIYAKKDGIYRDIEIRLFPSLLFCMNEDDFCAWLDEKEADFLNIITDDLEETLDDEDKEEEGEE